MGRKYVKLSELYDVPGCQVRIMKSKRDHEVKDLLRWRILMVVVQVLMEVLVLWKGSELVWGESA